MHRCVRTGAHMSSTLSHTRTSCSCLVGWTGTLEPEWCPAPSFHLCGCSCQCLSLNRCSVRAAGEKSRKPSLRPESKGCLGRMLVWAWPPFWMPTDCFAALRLGSTSPTQSSSLLRKIGSTPFRSYPPALRRASSAQGDSVGPLGVSPLGQSSQGARSGKMLLQIETHRGACAPGIRGGLGLRTGIRL